MKKIALIFTLGILLLANACKEESEDNTDSDSTDQIEGTETDEDESETDASGKVPDLSEYYAHYSGKIEGKEVSAEVFSRDGNIVLVFHSPDYERYVSMSGKFDKNGTFSLKAPKSDRLPQISIDAKLRGKKLIGSLKGDKGETEIEMQTDYKDSEPMKAYSFTRTETPQEEASYENSFALYLPENPTIADSVCRYFFDKAKSCSGNPKSMMKKDDEEFYSLFESAVSEGMGFMNWTRNKMSDVIYNDKGILSYAVHWDEYSGGAHGMYGSNFLVFDITSGKRLMLNDVIEEPASKFWQDKIYEKLSEQYKPEDLKADFSLPISPSENFFISPKGIGFFYNPYEIAPYVYGGAQVFIPFSEVSDKIKPVIKNKF